MFLKLFTYMEVGFYYYRQGRCRSIVLSLAYHDQLPEQNASSRKSFSPVHWVSTMYSFLLGIHFIFSPTRLINELSTTEHVTYFHRCVIVYNIVYVKITKYGRTLKKTLVFKIIESNGFSVHGN